MNLFQCMIIASSLFLTTFGLSHNDTKTWYCPTMETSVYILVTNSPNLNLEDLLQTMKYYASLMPLNGSVITYEFHFGKAEPVIIATTDLEAEIDSWRNNTAFLDKIYTDSTVTNFSYIQYDGPHSNLSAVMRSIFDFINKENYQGPTVYKKKQVIYLSDYVNVNVTEVMNSNTNVNQQVFGIFYGLNLTEFRRFCNFSIFSEYDPEDHMSMSEKQRLFQGPLNLQFPKNIYENPTPADNVVYMTEIDTLAIQRIYDDAIVNGSSCAMSSLKIASKFVEVVFAKNNSIFNLTLPWIGEYSRNFTMNCISNLYNYYKYSDQQMCNEVAFRVIEAFKYSAITAIKPIYLSLISNCTLQYIKIDRIHSETINYLTNFRIVTAENFTDVYKELIPQMNRSNLLRKDLNYQVIPNNAYYLTDHSTFCKEAMPYISLNKASFWKRPKYFRIALKDLIVITICSSISVTTFGCIFYHYIKLRQKKQMELLKEIMRHPRIYKAEIDCPKVARLPWEIKSENVHIDREFLLGEGTVSNVYLGKLKGKAPILQWIHRVEMQQYQDCAVAVRVPKHFDEPEEDQLLREINSMRRLRHHDHIALFLGWTNKNNLVVSLLELTHQNLIKYLFQIKETLGQNGRSEQPHANIPYQALYKIIHETCDGMAYIHSRSLVHRDLTARNILLTTGLRAKISGFGFCSEPQDTAFGLNSLALRYLPVRWLAPECFNGNFSYKSDSWSFAVTLYEIFSLGDVPYEDLRIPDEIIETVRKGRIPAMPKYATKHTYSIMQQCFHKMPQRRLSFLQMKEIFEPSTETSYHNAAFEMDELLE